MCKSRINITMQTWLFILHKLIRTKYECKINMRTLRYGEKKCNRCLFTYSKFSSRQVRFHLTKYVADLFNRNIIHVKPRIKPYVSIPLKINATFYDLKNRERNYQAAVSFCQYRCPRFLRSHRKNFFIFKVNKKTAEFSFLRKLQ